MDSSSSETLTGSLLLYTSIPKFEELTPQEKQLYHNNKEFYNKHARQGTKSLYFAKSATQGETWVPLIEKAYAKLHGSYAALNGGQACEAIEDLTGGISTFIPTRDIFDIDRFWNEELRKANVDRLFGCTYQGLSGARSGDYWHSPEIFGLLGDHAYSVLRAVEVNGKRFVVVRNPWGRSEWTGPWSDGSKEWTKEWLERLPEFGHVFGDDGQFVMEFKDFLSCWDTFDRTLLLDDSWAMSSQWLHVTARPLPSAWTFGDVSCRSSFLTWYHTFYSILTSTFTPPLPTILAPVTFSLSEPTLTIIVLSQIDSRYFKEISGCSYWQFDFIIFKAGKKEIIAESSLSRLYARSVNVEVNLDAGDYVIHVRLDRKPYRDPDYFDVKSQDWDQRSLSRMKSERAIGQSIASNFKKESERNNLPVSLNVLAGQNLSQLESKYLAKKKEEEEEANAKAEEKEKELLETEQSASKEAGSAESEPEKNSTTTVVNDDGSTTTITTSVVKKVVRVTTRDTEDGEEVESREEVTTIPNNVPVVAAITIPINGGATQESDTGRDGDDSDDEDDEADPSRDVNDVSEDNSIFLGLKVYTKREVSPVKIAGQLGHGMELSAELALL
ncbi:cysteine proteinase [Dendrothele bispora CBS 962.96]|uniref:Cysteine proteinase n=1 Tax=Dendrothele bispora (strain CBS 962.96) TaxID=1314807 RepID=A0A4S8KN12_DENBC|nr:cysteine proteinase [Dendrothele bispora CBS 962.96]